MRRLALLFALYQVPLAFAQDYAIDAPAEAHIRQRIDVGWTAPDSSGGLIEILPDQEGARRVAYSYIRNNPEGIEVPEQPGAYRIALVLENQVRVSLPLNVIMATATVSGPVAASAGETIDVSWTGPASRSDQITWAEHEGQFIRGTSYAYVQDATEGTRGLRAPAEAGDYDIIYRSGDTILARHAITIGSIEAMIRAPASTHAGGTIAVTFEGPKNTGDLIAFADRGAESRYGVASYAYVGNAIDSSVSLRVSETPGAYDIVYISNDSVIGRAPIEVVTANVTVSGPGEVASRLMFSVDWSGSGNAGDQIFIADAEGNEYDYAYIDPHEPTVKLVAPADAGDYTLIYRTRGGARMDSEALAVTLGEVPPGELVVTEAEAQLGNGDAVEIILDASGSMLQRIGDTRRIEIAKSTLNELVAESIPAGTGFVLRVFGHREPDSCRTDLEIPLGPLNVTAATATISGIDAMNLARTPIGASIAATRSDLADVPGQRVLVVLTDGEETCEGNAAIEIESLRSMGWDIRVNIVGFAIDDDELVQTFESWAAAGSGEYFNATNADDLGEALTRAVATRFRVVDSAGATVAAGLTGDDAIVLPSGKYRVIAGAIERPVTVVSDTRVVVGL